MPESEAPGDPAAERRARLLLVIGACLGIALAAVGILRRDADAPALPDGVVASVNGHPLRLEEYLRALQALASDRRDPLGESEKRHVLDRLVDEELLVQRALELGLAQSDRRVRGDLVSAVIQAVVSQSEASEPSDAEVADFYAGNRDYFARSGRVLVQQVLVRAGPTRAEDEAHARADEVARRLRAGEPLASVDAALGDAQVAPVPSDHLPLAKLREYLGPTVAQAAEALVPGGVSDPLRASDGYHVIVLVDREAGSVPPLAAIREEVRAELRRRSGDSALRDYLAELRERAELRVTDALP